MVIERGLRGGVVSRKKPSTLYGGSVAGSTAADHSCWEFRSRGLRTTHKVLERKRKGEAKMKQIMAKNSKKTRG